jgi:hypothetical protein
LLLELKEIKEEGMTPTSLALAVLSHTGYKNTEQFKNVARQSKYKKQIQKVEESYWWQRLNRDSTFSNIRFEVYALLFDIFNLFYVYFHFN